MPEDPIVEEIHKIREKLLEQYGGFDGLYETCRATSGRTQRPNREPRAAFTCNYESQDFVGEFLLTNRETHSPSSF